MHERDQFQELHKAEIREKIAAGMASFPRRSHVTDGEEFLAAMDAELAKMERQAQVMAARYSLTSEAKQDLVASRNYYVEKAGAQVARRVVGEITRALRFLATTPGAGHARTDLTGEPVRFWPVFSYLVVYDPATKPIGVI